MATEVLRPRDCLIQRIRVSPASFPRRKACNYGNSYSNPSRSSARPNRKQIHQQQQPAAKPEVQRKRLVPAQPEPSTSFSRSSSDDLRQGRSSSGLVMEKVTILRRGESLDSKIKSQVSEAAASSSGLVVCDGTQRLGPDPAMVPKQVRMVDLRSPAAARRCDVYAGSAFAVSPEPSSLPLPSFSKKKHVSFDDSATRDLRRLLRLD
ncbi:uncharacterized protein LOC130136199 [Syzygium oleosum]|uniref:uncharacterized protein LOC115691358 n=1 Tax=Syzygium oleosum TaxID=219896 RepID=UPI0011D28F03|nr:uncharacterized protein LOC115691358 [Syzygium oleosum]XP_056162333.1 uncharacterized protein LOC130136199 [Syzygium oleosum]